MRMPKCSELFYYYLSKFATKAGNIFPDPGLVATLLALGKDCFIWRANTHLPPEIKQIYKNRENFILPIVILCIKNGNKASLLKQLICVSIYTG